MGIPKVDIVVARYNEDITWVASVVRHLRRLGSPDVRAYVYNKGLPLPCDTLPGVRVVPLPNVGRESHTYLHHMVKHYSAYASEDRGKRLAVFLQGRLDDHVGVSKGNEALAVEALVLDAVVCGGASLSHAQEHRYLAHHGAFPDFTLAEHPPGQPIGWRVGCTLGQWVAANVVDAAEVFARGGHLQWWIGALFCIDVKLLATPDRRPLSYYTMLRTQVSHHASHELCHFLERAWVYVTGAHEILTGGHGAGL